MREYTGQQYAGVGINSDNVWVFGVERLKGRIGWGVGMTSMCRECTSLRR